MSSILWIFRNKADGRLRSLWRMLVFGLFFLLFLAFQTQVFLVLNDKLLAGVDEGTETLIGVNIAEWELLIAVLAAIFTVGRYLDRRSLCEYGLRFSRRWWADLGFGLLLGAVLMTGIFLTEYMLGWVTIRGTFESAAALPFAIAILLALSLFVAGGIFEELLFRGYLLQNLAEGLHFSFWKPVYALILAWVIASIWFGLAHVLNPEASPVSTLNIVLAGLLLGLGYILTGDLAIPIGLHMTWNFFQGNVFGFPVSGAKLNSVTLVAINQQGPALWTGGAFGPEAGLLAIVAITIGALLMLGWVNWRYGGIQLQISIPQPPQQKTSGAVTTPDA